MTAADAPAHAPAHASAADPASLADPAAPGDRAAVAGTGPPAGAASVRPGRTLGLLSAQHALIHAQSALLPLVFVEVIGPFGVGVGAVGLLLGISNILSGSVQLLYGPLARHLPRGRILGVGGIVFGAGTAVLAFTTSWLGFSLATVVGRLGGSPQHTVGHALLAEQYPAHRRASAISTHIAIGNLGTLAIPLVGGWLIATSGWQTALLVLGLPGIVAGAAILLFVREAGTDRAAALASGSTLAALRSLRGERDLLWVFAASSVAAAGRGLGIVTTFIPLYLSLVLDLDTATIALMYTLLLIGSVPGPIVAGRIADRLGHRPVLVATYVLGAVGLVAFVLAGTQLTLVWLAIGFLSAFVYEESSLLQALLADVARPAIRDVAFGAYFTLMFVVGAIWAAVLGWIVASLGNEAGFPVIFGIMAASYLIAALVVLPIRAGGRSVLTTDG